MATRKGTITSLAMTVDVSFVRALGWARCSNYIGWMIVRELGLVLWSCPSVRLGRRDSRFLRSLAGLCTRTKVTKHKMSIHGVEEKL